MFELDATVAAAIFFSSFFLDLIAARYTSDVVSLRAGRAASLSFLWHMLSAIVVIEYAHNAFYIVFVCLGGGLGTYFTIWSTRRARSAGERPDAVIEIAVLAVPQLFAPALQTSALQTSALRTSALPTSVLPNSATPRSRAARATGGGASARRCATPSGRARPVSPAVRRQDCVFEGPRAQF
jgi:hypothetical protein